MVPPSGQRERSTPTGGAPASDAALERRPFRTVTVLGEHLKVLNAQPATDERFTRQLPLLGPDAQAAIGILRVGLVGAGGTGSHICLALAYLGFRDFVILDDDLVDTTNLNRLVTADQADLQSPKTIVARRRMRAIDPRIKVRTLPGLTPADAHPELNDVDLIIGCVDHDGPRHRLNQIAIDTRTPLLDIATGVDERGTPVALGGRVALIAARRGLPDLPGRARLRRDLPLGKARARARPRPGARIRHRNGEPVRRLPQRADGQRRARRARRVDIRRETPGALARHRPDGDCGLPRHADRPSPGSRTRPRVRSTARTRREQRRFQEPQLSFPRPTRVDPFAGVLPSGASWTICSAVFGGTLTLSAWRRLG